jgi:membrane protein DedA with SNARE-associated domain
MDFLLTGISQHGYSILFAIVFLESVGFPVPAAIALLIAGASLRFPLTLVTAFSALLVGDTLMFLAGRFTGWWLLGVLCRLSLNPESCILRSADAFYRRGRTVLLFAKFVPGINTMAAPLAGSMSMRLVQFLRLDLAGIGLYVGVYASIGFLFSGALGAITSGYQAFGRVLSGVVIAALVLYLGLQAWIWIRASRLRQVPFVLPSEAAHAISSGDAVIYDVRSHGYYDQKAMRIQGSRRLEPSALHQPEGEVPPEKHVYLYCTCVREATSARVAHELREKGMQVSVIKGGLRAWKKAGLPIEPVPAEDLVALPSFGARE